MGIVAGAGWGGIGGAAALRLASEGARLVINAETCDARLRETESRVRAIGKEVVMVEGDAAAEETWRSLTTTVNASFGRLDTLVYVPASGIRKNLADLSAAEWDECFSVTVRGAWIAARAAVPLMRSSGGAMVFVSSVNASPASPGFGAYGSAKAALNALVRSIALECSAFGFRANAVAPGQIETGSARLATDPAEERASRLCYPIGRLGRPEDVANAILFLASDEASFVTGTVLTVDGGFSIVAPTALVRPSLVTRLRKDFEEKG